MLAIDIADARGRSLAIAAVMSVSKFFGAGLRLMLCRVVNEAQFTYQALILFYRLPVV